MPNGRSLAGSCQSQWLDQKSEQGFVPPESGFFIGKRIQESLGPVEKAISLKGRRFKGKIKKEAVR
jgi:hypothetical protein